MTPTSGRSTHPRYRPDIDGLRAIAVFSVVVFHAFPSVLRGGFIGVDVFFVISGFLISSIIFDGLNKGEFSLGEFYRRRIRRIFPALVLVLAACGVTGWVVLAPNEYSQLGKHISGGAGFVANLLFWRESGYFNSAALSKSLLHLWSLAVEEQFYLFWPTLAYLCWKRRFNLLLVCSVVLVASFVLNLALVNDTTEAAYYLPATRLWEILLGSVLAYSALYRLAGKVDTAKFRNIRTLSGCALIIGSALLLDDNFAFPGWWAVLPTVGTCLIISAGPQAWVNRVVLSHPVVVWVGLISYPLYLWHWPLLSFANIIEGPLPRTIRLVLVLVSVLLAWLTYKLVELPIRQGEGIRHSAFALSGLMIALGSFGLYVYVSGGASYRFPKPLVDLIGGVRAQPPLDAWRATTCYLDESTVEFSDCVDKGEGALIFLWGDSHAAALYPGLKELQKTEKFRIAQFTVAGCPPLLSLDTKRRLDCRGLNDANMERIRTLRPATVLLHADWSGLRDDLAKLPSTILRIQDLGIPRIVVLGPVPQWQDSLQKSLFLYYSSFGRIPPARMDFHLDGIIRDTEPRIERISDRLGVQYISATAVFCNREGCLTQLQIPGKGVELTAVDHGHLSVAGSVFLAAGISRDLLDGRPQ